MKLPFYILFFLLVIIFHRSIYSQDCKKCEIEKLSALYENMDSLDYDLVYNFVCTFDSSCNTNIEYSQWSNELLFDLIEKDVNLLNRVLYELGYEYVLLVANELEYPIVEEDLVKIFEIVKNASGPKDMIVTEKEAIKKAADKEGLRLEN